MKTFIWTLSASLASMTACQSGLSETESVCHSTLHQNSLDQEELIQEIKQKIEGVFHMQVFVQHKDDRKNINTTGYLLNDKGHILAMGSGINEDLFKECLVSIADQEYNARLVKVNKKHDYLILKLDNYQVAEDVPALVFGQASALKTGESVISAVPTNADYGHEAIIYIGSVAGTIQGKLDIILSSGITFRPVSGSSILGSPLVNLDGEVLGFLTKDGHVMSDTIVKSAYKFLDKQANGLDDTEDEEPWLGFMYQAVNKDISEALQVPHNSIEVVRVVKNSPIYKCGIRANDFILSIDGNEFTKKGLPILSQMRKWMDLEIGESAEIEVLRQGKKLSLTLTPDKKPSSSSIAIEEFGIHVKDLQPIDVFSFNLKREKGVLLTKLESGSSATTSTYFGKPLMYPGDIILEVDRQVINTVQDLRRVVQELRDKKQTKVLLKIFSGNQSSYLSLNIEIGQKTQSEGFQK